MVPYGTVASAIWLWDNSAVGFVDLTASSARLGSSTPLLAEAADYLYIGYERRFDALMWWLSPAGIYTGLTWECSVEGDWARWVPVQPVDWEFNSAKGYLQLDLKGMGLSAWAGRSLVGEHSVTPPDEGIRHWVRCAVIGVDTVAMLDSVTVRPYASVATPQDVQRQLQVETEFTQDTVPSFETVETFLRGAEDAVFRVTGHYYRPDFVEDELLDFKGYGMHLRHRPILDILELAVWNGNEFETKRLGRDQDWHYEAETGMIYIATIFLDVVPPILRRGYSVRRQQGAFKRGVRLRYVHGHDTRVDSFAVEVGRTVVKQAAVDVVTDRDFALLIPSNLDRVSLKEKADLWNKDVEEFLERYAKLAMF